MDERTDPIKDEPPERSSIFGKLTQNILKPSKVSDLLSIIDICAQKDLIDEQSKNMLSGVINISKMHVRDIMVARSQMVTININEPTTESLNAIVSSAHTRIPVWSENKEHITGILHVKDALKLIVEAQSYIDIKLKEALRPAIFVPESKRLDWLLKEFKQSHYHLAVVLDEYGATSGIVTIEDILEEIVGEIEDEFDEVEQHIRKKSANEYEVDAVTPLEVFNDYFDTQFDDETIDTIGGLIVHKLEHLPETGEILSLNGLYFKILEANKRRICKIGIITQDKD